MNRTLRHRGYEGSILFSEEDNMFHGRILLPRDSVSYGGDNLEELEKNFREATDEYLSFCEAENKQPDQTSKSLNR